MPRGRPSFSTAATSSTSSSTEETGKLDGSLAQLGPPLYPQGHYNFGAPPHHAPADAFSRARGSSAAVHNSALVRAVVQRGNVAAGLEDDRLLTSFEMQRLLTIKMEQMYQWLSGRGDHSAFGLQPALNTLIMSQGEQPQSPNDFFKMKAGRVVEGGQIICKVFVEFYTRYPNGSIPTQTRKGVASNKPIFHISVFWITDMSGNPVPNSNNNPHITSDILNNLKIYTSDALFWTDYPRGYNIRNKARLNGLHANDILRRLVEDMASYCETGRHRGSNTPLTNGNMWNRIIHAIDDPRNSPLGENNWKYYRTHPIVDSPFGNYSLTQAQQHGRRSLAKSLRAFAKLWMIFCANTEIRDSGEYARDELHNFAWEDMKQGYERTPLDVQLDRGLPETDKWWGGKILSKKINIYIKKIKYIKKKLKLLNKNKNKNKIILKNKAINDLKEKIKNAKEKLKKEKLKKEKLKKEKLKKEKLKKEKLKKEKLKKEKLKKEK